MYHLRDVLEASQKGELLNKWKHADWLLEKKICFTLQMILSEWPGKLYVKYSLFFLYFHEKFYPHFLSSFPTSSSSS